MLTRTKVLDLLIAALLILTLAPGPATAGAPVSGPALAAAPTTRAVEPLNRLSDSGAYFTDFSAPSAPSVVQGSLTSLSTSTTTRVSVASDGGQGNGNSYYSSISADGRYVAFCSYASNLVSGDTNGYVDVFIHDRGGGPGPDSFADLGNFEDETEHNLIGWGAPQGPPENPLVSPSGDKTKRYQALRADNSLDLMVDEASVPYLLTVEVEDGVCTDNFEVYVNGEGPLYQHIGVNAGTANMTVLAHHVEVSDVVYYFTLDGTGWETLNRFVFDSNASIIRENNKVHVRYPIPWGAELVYSSFTLKGSEIISSNADETTNGSAIWHNPTGTIEAVLVGKTQINWLETLCFILAFVVVGTMIFKSLRHLEPPRRQH